MNRSLAWSIPALALLLTAGCSRSELVTGTGRVTYKGQPVPNTYVTFLPEAEGKRSSHGLTDDRGTFSLTHSRSEAGVLRGRHTVFLRYRATAEEEQNRARASEEMKSVLARYSDPKTSELHYEVTT